MDRFFMYWEIGVMTTEYALNNKNIQEFINRNDLTFDLVISEQFFQEAFLVLAHKYNTPVMSIG
jgi:glucuronosyltransferase